MYIGVLLWESLGKLEKVVFQVREVSHKGLLKYQAFSLPKTIPQYLHTRLSLSETLRTQISWEINARKQCKLSIQQS